MANEAAKLVSESLLGEDYKTVFLGGKAYTIHAPVTKVICQIVKEWSCIDFNSSKDQTLIQIGGVNQVSNMPDNWIQGAYEGGAASYFNHPEFICTPNPINVKPNSQYVISAENGYRIDILEFNSGV